MYPLLIYIPCDYSEGARIYEWPASFHEIQVLCKDRPPADRVISVPYFVGMLTIKTLFKTYRSAGSFRRTVDEKLSKKILLGDIYLSFQREKEKRDVHVWKGPLQSPAQ
jgi:hypothetical protein